jgi:transcriptional regulator, tetR family
MPTRSDMKAETQRRVLAEADRLFRERGLAATTVRDIAAASGVSVGTVMAVGDKSALLVKVFDSLIEETHAARRETPPRGGNRVVRVLSLVEPFLQTFASRQELARAYGSILLSGNHSSEIFTRLTKILLAEIRDAISSPGRAPDDLDRQAQALYYAYLGVLFTWATRPTFEGSSIIAELRTTFETICNHKEHE